MYKPSFNVVEPFEEVTMIQVNQPMRELLIEFLEDMASQVDDLETELIALGKALKDPVKAKQLRHKKRSRNYEANNNRG